MTPFSKYINCLNCNNELTHLSNLVFSTPDKITCDFCGQEYPGLSQNIKKAKFITGMMFLIPSALIFIILFDIVGIYGSLFTMFPIFIIYLYTLALVIKKKIKY